MYQLIITIVAIALGVAATAAAMFYGGDTLTGGRNKADAAAFITGGQQIVGSIQMYQANEGVLPADLAELETTNYLNGLPVVKGGNWGLDETNAFVTAEVNSSQTCEAINNQAGESTPESVASIAGLFGCITGDTPVFQMRY